MAKSSESWLALMGHTRYTHVALTPLADEATVGRLDTRTLKTEPQPIMFGNQRPRILRKSARDLEGLRRAGRLASECLQHLVEQVEPGMTTQDLDDLLMAFAARHKAVPALLGYNGFPKSVCTSVDEVICHGIPSAKRILKDGETIGIDVVLIVDGYHGDNCSTVAVGTIDDGARRLIDVALEATKRGIEAVRPGAYLGDVAAAIQTCTEAAGYSVVRDFVGHGIGRELHEAPQVLHYGKAGRGVRLTPGMTFTVEPMINEGDWRHTLLADDWTAVTRDGKRSAQFEHSVAVTADGVEILTSQESGGGWEVPGNTINWR